jgi:hypothetical protein
MRLERFADLFRGGGRAETRNDRSGPVDEEFREVPRDVRVSSFIRSLRFQESVEIAGAVAVDIDLRKQGKSDTESRACEFENLRVRARLLRPELVAGDGENRESARLIFFVKGMQTCILGSQASLTRDIDDEADLSFEFRKGDVLAGDGLHLEAVKRRHVRSSRGDRFAGSNLRDGLLDHVDL